MSNFNVSIDETKNQVTVYGDGTQILLVSQGIQGPAGTTDHGALTGLSDDDHTQYHNDTRGDVRYYTKTQSDLAYEPINANIQSHISSTSNPHSVTATQVGLGNVDNTSDLNKPISTATQTALDGKVDENAAITGATKTKITYDAKGLVTSGADATTADVADSTNKRYVTDAQLTVIGNTSGTNTGDQDLSSYATTSAANSYADGKVADAINNGTTTIAPSQNAVFDALVLKYDASNPSIYVDAAGAKSAAVSDAAYDATSWNGVTDVAPSKNAVRDQTETMLTSIAAKMPISGGTFTGDVVESVVALTDAATIAVDATLGNIFTVTLGGNRTLGNPTGAVNGQKLVFRIRQDGTGSRTLAYDTKFRFSGDISSITLTTTAAKTDYIGVIYHGSDDKFDVLAVNKGF